LALGSDVDHVSEASQYPEVLLTHTTTCTTVSQEHGEELNFWYTENISIWIGCVKQIMERENIGGTL